MEGQQKNGLEETLETGASAAHAIHKGNSCSQGASRGA